jgi:alkylated DNA repair dioxygenase AlkB
MDQIDLFGAPAPPVPKFPEGFRYAPDVVTREQEADAIERFRTLPFKEFEFHGYVGKRRTVSFGWHYDFAGERLRKADDMPAFLQDIREHAARFAGIAPGRLQHVLVTEYAEGAGIGWHRDKFVFGEVVGISLLSPCTFRLRRAVGDAWERVNLVAEPRSAYLMSGPSRTEWEHSIPGVDGLRYSITYRNLREDA